MRPPGAARNPPLLASALALALALACANPLVPRNPEGPVSIEGARGETCGRWAATAVVPSHRRTWELSVLVDGMLQPVVQIPAGQTLVALEGEAPAGRTVSIRIASEHASSAEVPVAIPPWEAALAFGAATSAFDLGDVPDIPLQVLGPCAFEGRLAVSVDLVPTGTPLLVRQAVGPGNEVRIPGAALREGRWFLAASLWDGESLVDERSFPLVVGPPCVDRDGDGVMACRGDCDDTRADVHPGLVDVVGDGIDSDCDGRNGRDEDGDGQEDRAVGGTDCDDRDPYARSGQIHPPDADGDGAFAWTTSDWNCDGVQETAPGPWDCDDADPTRPAAQEFAEPNGIDDDCDGIVDEGTVVYDDDGDGLAEVDGDCNDADATVRPGAKELGDCKDNDCDAAVDEGVRRVERDDAYEPNDQAAYALPGAEKKKRFLGIDVGYNPTRAGLLLTTRDRSDTETFSVWTHDGSMDMWHVSVSVRSIGDARSYDVTIRGEEHSTSGIVSKPGDAVILSGRPAQDETGTYTVEIAPRDGELTWCPLEVEIGSG